MIQMPTERVLEEEEEGGVDAAVHGLPGMAVERATGVVIVMGKIIKKKTTADAKCCATCTLVMFGLAGGGGGGPGPGGAGLPQSTEPTRHHGVANAMYEQFWSAGPRSVW